MSTASATSDVSQPPPARGLLWLLRLWFGVTLPVSPVAYAASGLGLMAVKYFTEAAAVWAFTGEIYYPWEFLIPSIIVRDHIIRAMPGAWLGWVWYLWSLGFLWIAITMSVRRAADAGSSPWLGLLVVVPLVNLVLMIVLCFTRRPPEQALRSWQEQPPRAAPASTAASAMSAVLSVGLSLLIGGVMIFFSVILRETYQASLFIGTPLLMSAAAGYFFNVPAMRGAGASSLIGMASVGFGCLALLLFALEGVVCLVMAMPLMLPLGLLGGMLGMTIAGATRRPARDLMSAVIVLPMFVGVEALLPRSAETMAYSYVEIDAPPEAVWPLVVEFPDLPPDKEWYFSLGLACPLRAHIVGEGPGAVRYCEFTTGAFVEPITVWDAPRRLAFDVTDQPPPLVELSPYQDIHPPHLHGYMRSTRGEFLLIALPDGRTRLEGRTWYTLDMFPQWYWTAWSDTVVHRIHDRVLGHIKHLAECPQ